MSLKKLGLLSILTLAVILAVFYTQPLSYTPAPLQAEVVFPALRTQLADIETITITTANTTFNIAQIDGLWVLPEKANYPISLPVLRLVLYGLADLHEIRSLQNTPDTLRALQLESPNLPDAQSTQLTLLDNTSTPLLNVIIGRMRTTASGALSQEFYLRDLMRDQISLVRHRLPPVDLMQDWINTTLIPFAANDIKAVDIHTQDATEIEFAKIGGQESVFELTRSTLNNPEIPAEAFDQMVDNLIQLELEDILDNTAIDFSEPESIITITNFDALQLSLLIKSVDDQYYIKVTPALADNHPSATLQNKLQTLQAKTEHWVFAVPSYQQEVLTDPNKGAH